MTLNRVYLADEQDDRQLRKGQCAKEDHNACECSLYEEEVISIIGSPKAERQTILEQSIEQLNSPSNEK